MQIIPLSISSNALSIVATSSENCTVSCFASANISQWTNNSGYLTSTGIESTSTNPLMATYFVATGTVLEPPVRFHDRMEHYVNLYRKRRH